MALCDAGPPSSRSADFLNKVAIPCPNKLSLYLLACRVASSMSLDSVTPWAWCTQPINTAQLAKRSRKRRAASHSTEINTKAIFYSSLLNGLILRAPTSKHAISHQVRLSWYLCTCFLTQPLKSFLALAAWHIFAPLSEPAHLFPWPHWRSSFRSLGRLHFSSQLHCICLCANPSHHFVSSLKARTTHLIQPYFFRTWYILGAWEMFHWIHCIGKVCF